MGTKVDQNKSVELEMEHIVPEIKNWYNKVNRHREDVCINITAVIENSAKDIIKSLERDEECGGYEYISSFRSKNNQINYFKQELERTGYSDIVEIKKDYYKTFNNIDKINKHLRENFNGVNRIFTIKNEQKLFEKSIEDLYGITNSDNYIREGMPNPSIFELYCNTLVELYKFITWMYYANDRINNIQTRFLNKNRLEYLIDPKTSDDKRIEYYYQLMDKVEGDIFRTFDGSLAGMKLEYRFLPKTNYKTYYANGDAITDNDVVIILSEKI